MLKITDLNVSYGAIHAIKDVSLEVNDGELVTLIGANGAGKTTILHAITGLLAPKSGKIEYDGHDLIKTPNHKIVSLGMAHVPEGRHIFPNMTVAENLVMGAHMRKIDKQTLKDEMEEVYEHFPRLRERTKQMLAMGRAIMSDPKILLLDEPSMGLSPLLVKEILSIIKIFHEKGITILLVEQNAKMALSIADRAYVLEVGRISMSGTAKELMDDDRVKKAYLGL